METIQTLSKHGRGRPVNVDLEVQTIRQRHSSTTGYGNELIKKYDMIFSHHVHDFLSYFFIHFLKKQD